MRRRDVTITLMAVFCAVGLPLTSEGYESSNQRDPEEGLQTSWKHSIELRLRRLEATVERLSGRRLPETSPNVVDTPDLNAEIDGDNEEEQLWTDRKRGFEKRLIKIEKRLESLVFQLPSPPTELDSQNQEMKFVRVEVDNLRKRVDFLESPRTRVPVVKRGTVVIDNKTAVFRDLRVNGIRYTVRPGRNEITVPYGPVTVELIGLEAPKRWNHWLWNGNRRELTILVRNQHRRVEPEWLVYN